MPKSPITSFSNPPLIVHTITSKALKTLQSRGGGQRVVALPCVAEERTWPRPALPPGLSRWAACLSIVWLQKLLPALPFLEQTFSGAQHPSGDAQRVLLSMQGRSYQTEQRVGKHEAGLS